MRMQTADDMQVFHIRVKAGSLHFGANIIYRHGIGAAVRFPAAECAEIAQRRADIRQIQMAVYIVVNIIAADTLAH